MVQGKLVFWGQLIGELKLDSGQIDVRPGVQIGYFHQDHRSLDFEKTPIEQIQQLKPRMEYKNIRAMLGQFQFTSDMVNTKTEKIKWGRKSKDCYAQTSSRRK